VLDGPANRLHPDCAGAFLEVLANAVVPQVIIANHAERLEYPALTLLDRLRWIQLIQSDTHYGVDTLDEKALTGTLR
jgi:predicted ATPase